MLRASSKLNQSGIDIKAVVDGNVDSMIPAGPSLASFAEALVSRNSNLERLRSNLVDEVGEQGMIEAAGTAANFQRMVRIADAIGIPLDDRSLSAADALIEELDIKTFHSASNTYRSDGDKSVVGET